MKKFTVIEITDEKPMKEWGKELMGARLKEAQESLLVEGVDQEAVFYFELEGKKYLAWYTDGEMLPADMMLEVNQDHAEIKKATGFKNRTEGEVIYDIP